MKLSSPFISFLILLTLTLFFTTNNSLAWEGFDQENNVDIEIPSGNLVREGLVIEFYVNQDLHLGRVITLTEIANGTELLVEDMNEDNKERALIMR